MSPRKIEILYKTKAYRLTATSVKQGDTVAEVAAPNLLKITQGDHTRCVELPEPPPHTVGYRSNLPLLTGMYRLAMHELYSGITPEGLLTAGAAWSSVWTRDIAYAAALGTDIAAPAATRRSLESRVRDGIILQDTGTGGGWPISTDRVVWAMGAWAYYQSSGDREWLSFSIDTLRNTLAQDAAVLRCTPLVPGETSFLDWREQSYPDWMTTADIGNSYAFSTNVLHYMARRILARMLREAGATEEAETYETQAADLAQAIDKTFHTSPRRYAMMCTDTGCLDRRSDALATALAVLGGLAGKDAESVMRVLPRTVYGTPVFTPFKSNNEQAYHNRAIWPFVEAFVLLAHAELQDMAGVEFSMASLLRSAMLFGTNKENLHAISGEAHTTVQNSDSQLWSVAGMLGLFYHGLLGIHYEHGNLVFAPCIPKSFAGSHWFTELKIRNMVLDVHLNGYGSEICSVMVNGKPASPIIPLDTEGHLQVELELMPPDGAEDRVDWEPALEDLPAPEWAACDAKRLAWQPVPGASKYRIFLNGYPRPSSSKCSVALLSAPRSNSRIYNILAANERVVSCPGSPMEILNPGSRYLLQPVSIGEHGEYPVEHCQAWLDTRPCTSHLIYEPTPELPRGTYRVRVLYANATASLRDGDTCALRELRVDGESVGIIALPHNTEYGRWDDYALSASLKIKLSEGTHAFSLHFTPACTNSNREINQCMVRYIELTRVSW